jgi:hypothetical protein
MREPSVGIASAIAAAARLTGVSASYLTATAARESGFDAQAKAATSSASGLFQFIDSTWLETLERHGESLGIADAASMDREQALALRFDPQLSALLAGALTADNAEILEQRLGRPPADGELYAAHVLGAGGAADLIRAAQRDPNQSAAELFPAAARANQGLFYGRDGAPVSAAQLTAKFAGMMNDLAPAIPAASPGPIALPTAAVEAAVSPVSLRAWTEGVRSPLQLSPMTIELLARLKAPERSDPDKA